MYSKPYDSMDGWDFPADLGLGKVVCLSGGMFGNFLPEKKHTTQK